MSWRDEVQDEETRKVLDALDDPAWDFRTLRGLAKATGLPSREVLAIIRENPAYIGESPTRSETGRRLFYLKSPRGGLRRFFGRLREHLS